MSKRETGTATAANVPSSQVDEEQRAHHREPSTREELLFAGVHTHIWPSLEPPDTIENCVEGEKS